MNKWWSAREESILRKYYRRGGVKRVEQGLQAEGFNRTRGAIATHASFMRVKAAEVYRQESTGDKIRASKLGNRNRWKEDLTPKYEEVKKLAAAGVNVACACKAVGITRDAYYRRRRIEMNGRDRG